MPSLPLAWVPGPLEWGLIAVVALLFFGKRLPEVGRSLGKSIVEFKRGLKDVQDGVESAASAPDKQPKFDPYTGKPPDADNTPPKAD